MAIGRRKSERQRDFWVVEEDLPKSQGHAFYRKLNELFCTAGFDKHVESPLVKKLSLILALAHRLLTTTAVAAERMSCGSC